MISGKSVIRYENQQCALSDPFKIDIIKWFPNNWIILWRDSQLDIGAESDELVHYYESYF